MKKDKSVSREQAEKRLQYLNEQLAHEGYWDGWSLKSMREEKESIEKQLKILGDKK
tara:strand:+ start:935 stop:1102 length:168 start_codon:yes stop_codon:yes gene_type:complete